MSGPLRYSLFLSPCAADRTLLDATIRQLAGRCGALPFEPHVTVLSGSHDDADAVREAVAAAVRGIAPFSLPVAGIGFSTEYFKSLFIEFARDEPIHALHDRLVAKLGNHSEYRLRPHLSLLYQDLPLAEKESLAGSIHLPRESVRFDAVKVVAPNDPAVGWRDTAGWRTLFRAGLDGGDPCAQ